MKREKRLEAWQISELNKQAGATGVCYKRKRADTTAELAKAVDTVFRD